METLLLLLVLVGFLLGCLGMWFLSRPPAIPVAAAVAAQDEEPSSALILMPGTLTADVGKKDAA